MTAAQLIAYLDEAPADADRPLTTELDVARLVARGLSVSIVRRLTSADPADGGLTPDEVERLLIPRRTLTKRRAGRQRLTLEESNRAARLARVLAVAAETFGADPADRRSADSREATRRAALWLRRPQHALDGEVPLDLCTTDAGARLVEDALGRIAHGVFA